jgi:two-component system sensor histidine kinase DesK
MTTPATPLDARPPRRRNVAWLWFAYTGFLLIDPFFNHRLVVWLGTFIVLLLYAFIFRAYTRCDENEKSSRRYWLIAATVALGALTLPFNGGASTFFVYAAAFVTYTVVSVRRILVFFACEAVLVLAEAFVFRNPVHIPHIGFGFHVELASALISIFLVVVIGGANIFFAEQKRFNDAQLRAALELRDAQEENMALAAVAERERIARDLHDVLGHTLSVITLKAELAGRLLAQNPDSTARAEAEIKDVERLARTSLAEVREAITGYRTRGLAAEIEAARHTLDAAGVTLFYEPQESSAAKKLSANEETVLALALREAVTNIVRHAHATTCTLRFVTLEGGAARRLLIEDNGKSPEPPLEGNGLRGMRARVESIGGKLALECDGGTRLLITLPQVTA